MVVIIEKENKCVSQSSWLDEWCDKVQINLSISRFSMWWEILNNTDVPILRDGINQVEKFSVRIGYETKEKWICNKDFQGIQIKPLSFLSGDIAVFNNILKKENYNGDWYCLCDWYISYWQIKGYDARFPWTIERLCEQAKKLSVKTTWTNCRGVRKKP